MINSADHEYIKSLLEAEKLWPLGAKIVFLRGTGYPYEERDGKKWFYTEMPDGRRFYVDDASGEESNYGTICVVGEECRHITQDDLGKQAWIPEMDPGIRRIGGEFFVVSEDLITHIIGE